MKKDFILLGILNLTPDSFSDGGKFDTTAKALKQAALMREAGADILDIGGESTRPGGVSVSVSEELKRVFPVVKKLRAKGFKISLDSRKPEVAEKCLPYIDWINDVSGLENIEMRKLVASSKKKVILMHALDLPVNPSNVMETKNVVGDLKKFFQQRIRECEKSGIKKSQIIIDVGIGFGKTLQQNLELIARIGEFEKIAPVCLGASRKSFIGKLDNSAVKNRLGGSIAAVLAGYSSGVRIFRIHDVAETKQALEVWRKI
ncbi:MAG: dihydropteroate synthase [Candidatus Gracilibacteria bacterium]